jgi:hypothetical protein
LAEEAHAIGLLQLLHIGGKTLKLAMEQCDGASILEAAEDEFFLALALGFLINARKGGRQRDEEQNCHRHDDQERVARPRRRGAPPPEAHAVSELAAPLALIAAWGVPLFDVSRHLRP